MTDLFKTPSGSAGEQISVQEAARRLDSGAILIDVREPDEYAKGHAPAALLLPLNRIHALGGGAIDTLGLPARTTDVLLICQSGMRSRAAQEILSRDTRRRHANVTGGMAAWAAQGLPVTQG